MSLKKQFDKPDRIFSKSLLTQIIQKVHNKIMITLFIMYSNIGNLFEISDLVRQPLTSPRMFMKD